MIIKDTDTPTLEDALAILRDEAALNLSARVNQTIRIKIKAIELTLADRKTA
jgi:hypothetical protein